MIRALISVLVFAAGLTAADRASDVKAAEKAWAVATVAGDSGKLGELLADDLTYTHSTGETDSKSVYIGNLKSGARKYLKVDHEGMEVRLYGNTAVLMTTAHVETTMNGGAPAPVHLRFLHVWVFNKGKWQLAAHQSLRLAK